jgi:hypothetical protein
MNIIETPLLTSSPSILSLREAFILNPSSCLYLLTLPTKLPVYVPSQNNLDKQSNV